MNIATLRVEGADEALENLRNQLGLDIDASWKRGEAKRHGHHSLSGFNAKVADAENPGQMVEAVRKFMLTIKEQGVVFSASNLSAELFIGVTVGDSVQFIAFVELLPADILLLGSLGVALSVTAYPTSDEANDTD
jgi:hypothetical protein